MVEGAGKAQGNAGVPAQNVVHAQMKCRQGYSAPGNNDSTVKIRDVRVMTLTDGTKAIGGDAYFESSNWQDLIDNADKLRDLGYEIGNTDEQMSREKDEFGKPVGPWKMKVAVKLPDAEAIKWRPYATISQGIKPAKASATGNIKSNTPSAADKCKQGYQTSVKAGGIFGLFASTVKVDVKDIGVSDAQGGKPSITGNVSFEADSQNELYSAKAKLESAGYTFWKGEGISIKDGKYVLVGRADLPASRQAQWEGTVTESVSESPNYPSERTY